MGIPHITALMFKFPHNWLKKSPYIQQLSQLDPNLVPHAPHPNTAPPATPPAPPRVAAPGPHQPSVRGSAKGPGGGDQGLPPWEARSQGEGFFRWDPGSPKNGNHVIPAGDKRLNASWSLGG